MTLSANQLLEKVLPSSNEERSEFAPKVIDSLDTQVDENSEAEWNGEIRRRLEEIDGGLTDLIPWTEARRLIMDDSDDGNQCSTLDLGEK